MNLQNFPGYRDKPTSRFFCASPITWIRIVPGRTDEVSIGCAFVGMKYLCFKNKTLRLHDFVVFIYGDNKFYNQNFVGWKSLALCVRLCTQNTKHLALYVCSMVILSIMWGTRCSWTLLVETYTPIRCSHFLLCGLNVTAFQNPVKNLCNFQKVGDLIGLGLPKLPFF